LLFIFNLEHDHLKRIALAGCILININEEWITSKSIHRWTESKVVGYRASAKLQQIQDTTKNLESTDYLIFIFILFKLMQHSNYK